MIVAIRSYQYGFQVEFPKVYAVYLAFSGANCQGDALLGSLVPQKGFRSFDQVRFTSWFDEQGFGDNGYLGKDFFNDLPPYMMASFRDDGSGKLGVNMMSLFKDKTVFHIFPSSLSPDGKRTWTKTALI
jgi:hypothetical protein